MLKLDIQITYNALIPSHTDIRSSCTLGLEVSTVDGKTSVSKRPMHFLRNGCKGSNSVASLHTIRNLNQDLHRHEAKVKFHTESNRKEYPIK